MSFKKIFSVLIFFCHHKKDCVILKDSFFNVIKKNGVILKKDYHVLSQPPYNKDDIDVEIVTYPDVSFSWRRRIDAFFAVWPHIGAGKKLRTYCKGQKRNWVGSVHAFFYSYTEILFMIYFVYPNS